MTNPVNGAAHVASERPAESAGGLAAAIAVLLVYFLDIEDPNVVVPMIVVVGAVPTAVTWIVGLFRPAAGQGG